MKYGNLIKTKVFGAMILLDSAIFIPIYLALGKITGISTTTDSTVVGVVIILCALIQTGNLQTFEKDETVADFVDKVAINPIKKLFRSHIK